MPIHVVSLLNARTIRPLKAYEVVSKIFRTDAVRIVKLAIRPIGRRHPRSSSLSTCRHRSHRLLHFWNAFWKSFSIRVSSTLRFGLYLLIGIKRHPFSFSFIFGNRKKSQGAKSGEYGGWGMTAILVFVRNCWVRTEV